MLQVLCNAKFDKGRRRSDSYGSSEGNLATDERDVVGTAFRHATLTTLHDESATVPRVS